MADTNQRSAEALIARISASRGALESDLATLRRRWDVPARIKDSILSKPLAWFGGSLGAGFVTSLLVKRPRRREEKRRRGLWSLALGGAFSLARPALQTWALRALQTRFIPRDEPSSRQS